MTKSTIALALMAHNEAHLLPRLEKELNNRINSVIVLSDPPNNDDTVSVAKSVFSHYPNCIVEERPWPDIDNAAVARNQILDRARQFGDDYVLWMDPDSPIIGTIPDELTEPLYAFITLDKPSNISWFTPHLIRADQTSVRWVGEIHEQLDTGNTPVAVLATIIEERTGSGGGTERLRDWDLPTLLRLHAKEPTNPRHLYYLAQTYRDLSDYDNAIKYYKMRSQLHGVEEETFYAIFMVGCMYLLKSDVPNGERWLLRAHAYRPTRHEPLQALSELYQTQSNATMAIQLMKNSLLLPPPQDPGLVHNRQLPQQLMQPQPIPLETL